MNSLHYLHTADRLIFRTEQSEGVPIFREDGAIYGYSVLASMIVPEFVPEGGNDNRALKRTAEFNNVPLVAGSCEPQDVARLLMTHAFDVCDEEIARTMSSDDRLGALRFVTALLGSAAGLFSVKYGIVALEDAAADGEKFPLISKIAYYIAGAGIMNACAIPVYEIINKYRAKNRSLRARLENRSSDFRVGRFLELRESNEGIVA